MADLVYTPLLMTSEPREDYRLIDSGDGRKFEQYGRYRFVRPEPQAMWPVTQTDWLHDGEFIPGSDEDGGGRWHLDSKVPVEGWDLGWEEVRFRALNTPFRHLGFFPDMDPVWRWLRAHIGAAFTDGDEQPEALNLFGYTGVGTLAMAAAGAKLTHVDASKKSVAMARENAERSGLQDLPVRWLIDDAAKFTAREVRRGRRYDVILLDPPKFGRGPDGETWRLEQDLPGLIADAAKLLDEQSRALFLTVYAVRMSALALGELLNAHLAHLPGTIEIGELAVREEAGNHLLPTAIFARWSNDPTKE
jgi:23S rRNA (cytosine1962-C5)-methyltransferase